MHGTETYLGGSWQDIHHPRWMVSGYNKDGAPGGDSPLDRGVLDFKRLWLIVNSLVPKVQIGRECSRRKK